MRGLTGWRSNQTTANEVSLGASVLIVVLSVAIGGCASGPSIRGQGHWVNLGIVMEGPDKEFCDAVFAHLMSLRPACRVDGVETYPGFIDPPWQTVNAEEHRLLLQSLLRYARITSMPDFEAGIPHAEQYWQARADEFLSRGGKMQVWTTDLITPSGQQRRMRTIVQLVDNPGAEPNDCPGPNSKNIRPQTFIVDDAMQAPAANVDYGLGIRLAEGSVVLYGGEAMIVNMNFVGRIAGNICYFSRDVE